MVLGVPSINIITTSRMIGIVVTITITENTNVQIGSITFQSGCKTTNTFYKYFLQQKYIYLYFKEENQCVAKFNFQKTA